MTQSSPVDILIVDDRLDGLLALEAVLGSPRYNLVRAHSGHEALELLPDYDFGLILLDVQMPILDGFETAALIREQNRYRHTPIIFVTAINKDDRYIYKGYEVGAVDYIFKPFEPHILRSKVNFFIDLHLMSRQLQAQNEIIRESERRERYLKLAELEVESLKRYRDLSNAIPHIVWKSKIDGTLDYFNRIWSDFTGLTQEQSKGSGWQSAVHPDDLNLFLKTWIHSINSKTSFDVECRMRRFDGEMRWHWVKAVPEMNNSEEIIAWIGTCTDIHDRKLTEEKLVAAEKEANAANIAKTHFLANMSHEIRTPLSAILGFTELMMDPDQSAEDRLTGITTIRRSSQQLLRLIGEILDISKVETGHLEMEVIKVNLISLLSELHSLLNIQAQAKELNLEVRFSSAIPEFIFTDPTRLRQILMNIIGNAIKFSHRGNVLLDLEWEKAETAQAPGRMCFRVTDTGVGIDSEHIRRLFQPFMQVDSSTTRRFGGTGLGLALSRKLAQALNGDVVLERSEPERGSTFRIEIKAEPIFETPMRNSLEVKIPRENTPPMDQFLLKDIDVLLVDDALDNQMIFSQFLSSAGARVEVASNGQEGIEKALRGNFKVVLMDIQMPELDGYEATIRLRKQGYDRPIIALTAHALKEERDRSLKVGCTDHLTKPIDRRMLIQEVARFAGIV